jgi:hypothetical protein
VAAVTDAFGPPRFQTVSLHDHLSVGAEGLLTRAHELKVIEATAAGLDRIPFIHDTDALTLEVGQGCKGVSGYLRQRGDVYTTDILLTKELALGETLTLEYWYTYHYLDDRMDASKRRWRRAVMRRVENYDIRVEFHPDRLPSGAWWAVWDGIQGDVINQEPVSLDPQHSIQRYMRFIERTVVGFHWAWLDRPITSLS